MQPLTTTELLDVWERGLADSLEQRALWLLNKSQPERSLEAIGTLSIGQRDAQLMTLREQLFGSRIVGLSDCPQCDLRLQLDLDLEALRVRETEATETFAVTLGNYHVRCRLPNSFDMIAATCQSDFDAARWTLIERCVLRVECESIPYPVNELPPDVLEAIEAQMAQRDPQAQIQLALTCPQCSNTWSAAFDILIFLWKEIEAWAARLLLDVHTLASAYGWCERDILMLSARRRQVYLDLISA